MNTNKLQAILLDKQTSDYTGNKLTVGAEEIQTVSSVDVLGVTIKDRIYILTEFANLGSDERKVLINSFVTLIVAL